MAIPLIPVILIGSAAVAGINGLVKVFKAVDDNKRAKEINAQVWWRQLIIQERFWAAQNNTTAWLEHFGMKKLHVINVTVDRFLTLVNRIRNVELQDFGDMDELGKFKIDRHSFAELKELSLLAASFAQGAVGGVVAGSAAAFGAYSAVGTCATASTGAAISGLSGAAATKATLAFLGGGSLAAGGLGVAGGMAVLGGIIAGPALLALGTVMLATANANLENAYKNRALVQEAEAEIDVTVAACEGIIECVKSFTHALTRLDQLAGTQLDVLEQTIGREGTDYSGYSVSAREGVAKLFSTMAAIKTIIKTPILTPSGTLAKEAKAYLRTINAGEI